MKRLLTALVMLISLTTFAAPWDVCKPQAINKEAWTQPFKAAFTDPNVTGCFSFELSKNYQPNHVVQLQVTFDHSVPVPYYVIVSVLGNWATQPGYATERFFTILFPTGYNNKVVNYPMSSSEEIYPENTYVSDYGPQ